MGKGVLDYILSPEKYQHQKWGNNTVRIPSNHPKFGRKKWLEGWIDSSRNESQEKDFSIEASEQAKKPPKIYCFLGILKNFVNGLNITHTYHYEYMTFIKIEEEKKWAQVSNKDCARPWLSNVPSLHVTEGIQKQSEVSSQPLYCVWEEGTTRFQMRRG